MFGVPFIRQLCFKDSCQHCTRRKEASVSNTLPGAGSMWCQRAPAANKVVQPVTGFSPCPALLLRLALLKWNSVSVVDPALENGFMINSPLWARQELPNSISCFNPTFPFLCPLWSHCNCPYSLHNFSGLVARGKVGQWAQLSLVYSLIDCRLWGIFSVCFLFDFVLSYYFFHFLSL